MPTKVKAAAVSFEPWKWHKAENSDRMADFFERAAGHGAELVVGPECVLDGYVTYEAIDYPDRRERAMDIAEPIDGPYIARFCRQARALKANLVLGFAERATNGAVFNSAVFIDHDGTIAGRHRKMQLAEGTRAEWSFNQPGQRLRAFNTPLGRAGILICNDRWNPRLAEALVLDGARYLCIPSHGNRKPAQDKAVLARARENGVPIVQANVGVNLIVSRGEVVARDRGKNLITLATIDIPGAPSRADARLLERGFLDARPDQLRQNLTRHMEAHRRQSRQRSDKNRRKPVWRAPKVTSRDVPSD